jgi:DNA-directed RNA polymerase sigma subunit (sigma70/sigma32)
MAEIAGIRRQFVRVAMDAPFLEREEERGLAVRWKDMERARCTARPATTARAGHRFPHCEKIPRGRDSVVGVAMDAPFLEREEERGLAVRWKDDRDEQALHRLISFRHPRLRHVGERCVSR